MRAREFITVSKISLIEGLMKYSGKDNDWAKLKYRQPFVDETLPNDQTLSFGFERSVKNSDGKSTKEIYNKFHGKIINPIEVGKMIQRASKNSTLNSVTFSVRVIEVDEDGKETPTEKIIDNVRLNNIFKDEKITGTLTNINLGDVTEMILGCAVAAKFEKQDAMVTENDIVIMGQRLAEGKGILQTTAGKDQLQFKVTVPFKAKKVFFAYVGRDSRNKNLDDYGVTEKTINTIASRVKSAAEYANKSKRIVSAIEEARNDPRENRVDVVSEGGDKESQTSTKVDLKILIDGREVGQRLLSVKAGNVAQFGQVGGFNFANINEFFTSTLGISLPETLRKYFYDIPKNTRDVDDEKIYNYENGIPRAYDFALRQTKSKANTDEIGLLKDVYQGLMFHLTRHEPGVEMVILEPTGKKAFSELSFGPEFKQALDQLKIYVVELGGDNPGIGIYGFPQGSVAKRYIPTNRDADSKLVELRSQQTKTLNVRNRIGMGNLLKNIADIENYIEQQDDQQPQQQAPVATKKPVQQQPVQSLGLVNKQKPMATSKVPMAQPKPTKPIVPVAPGITNQ